MGFLTIGDITKDLLITKEKKESAFGGTSYCGITAAKLGYKSRILSRGNDTLSEWIQYLNEEGVEVALQQDRNVAYFVNDYSTGERRQLLWGYTEKIELNVNENFDVIHINPMFQEIDSNLVKRARKRCSVLSMDTQGVVRDVDKDKNVVGRFWNYREEFLSGVDILKVGNAEINLVSKLKDYRKICEDLNLAGARIVAITFGSDGSLVYDGDCGEFYNIPAYKTKPVDETGAGDIYATGLAIKYFENGKKDVLDCGLFASAAASFLNDFGPKKIAVRSEVEKRAKILKENYSNRLIM